MRLYFLYFLPIVCIFLLLAGCGDDGEYQEVDFSQVTKVEEQKSSHTGEPRLRAAVGAMISPQETFESYRKILDYISRELDMDLEFVQRQTYSEVNELLGKGEIDLAFICSGPYVRGEEEHGFRLLASPQVDGSSRYYSYLIVHKDSPYQELEDLRGKTFAFTDPDSNTGRMVPMSWVQEKGSTPEEFFQEIIYTYSHDNSILAVSENLVDGAAVDHLIWEYFDRVDSEITQDTRIIKKSQPFGIPPIVVSPDLDAGKKKRLKEAVLEMHEDESGQEILSELMIERFVPAQDEWYDSIREIHKKLEESGFQDAAQP